MEAGFLGARRCGRTRRVRIKWSSEASDNFGGDRHISGGIGVGEGDGVHCSNVDENCDDGWEGDSDFGDLGREDLEAGHIELDGLLA
jgi:hypothetical protein